MRREKAKGATKIMNSAIGFCELLAWSLGTKMMDSRACCFLRLIGKIAIFTTIFLSYADAPF